MVYYKKCAWFFTDGPYGSSSVGYLTLRQDAGFSYFTANEELRDICNDGRFDDNSRTYVELSIGLRVSL